MIEPASFGVCSLLHTSPCEERNRSPRLHAHDHERASALVNRRIDIRHATVMFEERTIVQSV